MAYLECGYRFAFSEDRWYTCCLPDGCGWHGCFRFITSRAAPYGLWKTVTIHIQTPLSDTNISENCPPTPRVEPVPKMMSEQLGPQNVISRTDHDWFCGLKGWFAVSNTFRRRWQNAKMVCIERGHSTPHHRLSSLPGTCNECIMVKPVLYTRYILYSKL